MGTRIGKNCDVGAVICSAMAVKKTRIEIPPEIAADALFASDRTCCVCQQARRPTQLHHIDEDPSNNVGSNIAVLCLECHNDTMLEGGFGRKLSSAVINKYKSDWLARVVAKRGGNIVAGKVLDGVRSLGFAQVTERDQEHAYNFSAEYVLITTSDPSVDSEVNLLTNALVTRELQLFRAYACDRTELKKSLINRFPGSEEIRQPDTLSLTHQVSLFNDSFLSVRYDGWRYQAGAGHPLDFIRTINFQLKPCLRLDLDYLFNLSSPYLETISALCIAGIRRVIAERRGNSADAKLDSFSEDWVHRGASPEALRDRPFVITRGGIVLLFEPYTVSSRTDGTFEIAIPWHAVKEYLAPNIRGLLGWKYEKDS